MDAPLEPKTANQLATGAPGTIVLGGETYLVSQPTKQDFVTLRKHLAAMFRAKAESTYASMKADLVDMPPDIRAIAIAEIVKSNKREPTDSELEDLLLEKDGVAFWAWVLIRKTQPAVKLKTIRDAIDDGNVDGMIAELLDAGGLKAASPN